MPVAYCPEQAVRRLSLFRDRPAVSVSCSTSTEGLVLQDAFAYGVLTNRPRPLGYASSGQHHLRDFDQRSCFAGRFRIRRINQSGWASWIRQQE